MFRCGRSRTQSEDPYRRYLVSEGPEGWVKAVNVQSMGMSYVSVYRRRNEGFRACSANPAEWRHLSTCVSLRNPFSELECTRIIDCVLDSFVLSYSSVFTKRHERLPEFHLRRKIDNTISAQDQPTKAFLPIASHSAHPPQCHQSTITGSSVSNRC